MEKIQQTKPGIRVCFVVLAHHQPYVFHKLIDVLAAEDVDIVAHIDSRSDLSQFERNERNLAFVTPRREVHWAGWSQTKTLLATLKFALTRSDAEYFVFLAGTDYPIKRLDLFIQHLAKAYPANFLNHYPLVPGIWGYGLCSRFHFVDLKAKIFDTRYLTSTAVSPVRKKCISAVEGVRTILNDRWSPRNFRHLNIYHGSSRWCLNRETVNYLVDYFHSGRSRQLRRFLRFSTSSDELFIQTTVLNSEMKKNCVSFDEGRCLRIFDGTETPLPDEVRVYFHYVDWSPDRENPAILDEGDLDALVASDKYFACKFLDDKSAKLINLLEKSVLRASR